MANKIIIKYLTETFEEIGNKEHENQFLEAMETLSEMNFAIKEMSFAELMDQSTWLAMNSHECQTDIEDFDDDSVLYETCRHNLLYWQTDVDLFYEEVCSANPELEWLDEFLVAHSDHTKQRKKIWSNHNQPITLPLKRHTSTTVIRIKIYSLNFMKC